MEQISELIWQWSRPVALHNCLLVFEQASNDRHHIAGGCPAAAVPTSMLSFDLLLQLCSQPCTQLLHEHCSLQGHQYAALMPNLASSSEGPMHCHGIKHPSLVSALSDSESSLAYVAYVAYIGHWKCGRYGVAYTAFLWISKRIMMNTRRRL